MSCGLPHKLSHQKSSTTNQSNYIQFSNSVKLHRGRKFHFRNQVHLLHVALLHRVCFLPASVEDSLIGLSNVSIHTGEICTAHYYLYPSAATIGLDFPTQSIVDLVQSLVSMILLMKDIPIRSEICLQYYHNQMGIYVFNTITTNIFLQKRGQIF